MNNLWSAEEIGLLKDDPDFFEKLADYAKRRMEEGQTTVTISLTQYEGLLRAVHKYERIVNK